MNKSSSIPEIGLTTSSFCCIPKIELHAHLSGSLSDEVTEKLLNQRKEASSNEKLPDFQSILKMGNERSLAECFSIFQFIKLLTNKIEAIKMITYDVIKEFNEDNVWYLELRTTPKCVEGEYTKQQYLEAVLDTVRETEDCMRILVRLLVSIDREKGPGDGWDTLKLAKEFSKHELYGKYIVGIDISGNPNAGSLLEFVPILKEAKSSGLKLAVHLFEVNTPTAFEEAHDIIREGLVDRIGHGTFLHPRFGGSQDLTRIVKEQKIPLELCISSNIKTGTSACLEMHHVRIWQEEDHPFAICTDDKGVFSTTLSRELSLYDQAIGGNRKAVESMILTSLQSSFLGEEEKRDLLQQMIFFFD